MAKEGERFKAEITVHDAADIPATIEVTAHAHPVEQHDGVFIFGHRTAMLRLSADEADVLSAMLKAAAATYRRSSQ